MNSEKNGKTLTQWLLMATIVLLALVLGLQLWQMFGAPKNGGTPPVQNAAGPENPLSSGKAAMIEDVRALNGSLSADDLARLSAQELEQLYETGAPGLPIGISAAAQAAEEYAGTLAVDSVTSETDPELDEAPAHYEVELHHPTLGDFAYKIDAYSGEVLEGTPDILQSLQAAGAPDSQDSTQAPAAQASAAQSSASQAPVQAPAAQAPASGTPAPSAAQPSGGVTGEEAAKQAAFAHAGIAAADASAVRCKLDWEDGRQVYEVAFRVGNTEYDYEIDASTSAVVKAQYEQENSGTPGQPSGSFIGEEAAKSAALAHAGIAAGDAGHIQCELDEDDGVWVYEIEFRAGGVEYEYEIGALDAAVLKSQQER